MLLAILMFAGCRPQSEEYFILQKNAPGGVYRYTVHLNSDETYDFSFYTRIENPSGEKVSPSGQIPIYVVWVPPTAEVEGLEEMVYMDPSCTSCLYRTGVSPKVSGDWTLEVFPAYVPEGFEGFGLVCKYNGTR